MRWEMKGAAWSWTVGCVLVVVVAAGCGNSFNILKLFEPTPAATPSPSPSPSPSPGASALVKPASVRVGFFGGSCPSGSGKVFPNNGAGEVPVGCTGFATATPKHADGTDLTATEHGLDISWALELGQSAVDVTSHRVRRLGTAAEADELMSVWRAASTQEPFNRDVRGVAAGPFRLCATVQSVRGCLEGAVTP